MRRVILLLALAAVIGVVAATSSACAIGLASGTGTWCGFIFVWPIGIIVAVPVAVLFGLPADLLYRKAGLRSWWQYVFGGLLLALPVWYEMAQPFASARWLMSGFFDSLNYLGSGALAGHAYWWLRVRKPSPAAFQERQAKLLICIGAIDVAASIGAAPMHWSFSSANGGAAA